MRDVFTIFVRIQSKLLLACLALILFSNCSDRIASPSRSSFPISVKLSYDTPKTLNLEYDNESDLRLVSTGTNLTVSVSSCASGYSISSTSITSGVVNLYKGDRNCLVKLTGFTLGSVSYSPTGGTDFTTWLNNDVATFKNTSGSDTIKVYVNSQVTQAGVQTSDTVVYKFTDVASTTTSNLGNTSVSTPVPLTVNGQAAPNFTVTQARYLSTNPNGSANMSFTLQCGNTLTGSSLATYACDTALLNSQLDYILIRDTYSQGTLVVAQATSAFNSNTPTSVGSLIVTPGSSDLNSNTLTKGGFYTSNASPLTTGTTPVYPSNLNYVFMLRQKDASGNTLSYLYFYVELFSVTPYANPVSACGGTFAGGSGTVGDPYQVIDRATLINVGNCTSSSTYMKLTGNIYLGGSGSPWTPIPLYGQLDGNNYTISGLYVSGGSNDDQGLFSLINSGTSITNLTIANPNVTGSLDVGILAGQMDGGTVTGVSISGGTLQINQISAGLPSAGPLVGALYGGTLTSVSSSASVTFQPTVTNSGAAEIGGLIGTIIPNNSAVSLSSCSSTGNVTVSSSSATPFIQLGGLIGRIGGGSNSALVSDCFATGNVTMGTLTPASTKTANCGGFLGVGNSKITIQGSFATGAVSHKSTSTLLGQAGGFISQVSLATNVTIQDNYFLGSVSFTRVSGSGNIGIGGFQSNAHGSTLTIRRNYSAAISVTANSPTWFGGFLGSNTNSSVITLSDNYFYDGPNVYSNTFSGVTARTTTAAMEVQSNYTNFDFSTPVWKMPSANPLSPNAILSPVHYWLCGTNGVVCP